MRSSDPSVGPDRRPQRALDQHRSINALAETINGLYKAEVVHRRRPSRSFDAVEFAMLEWVDWFKSRRLVGPIGNIPTAEAERRCTRRWTNPLWRRDSNETVSGKPGPVQAAPWAGPRPADYLWR